MASTGVGVNTPQGPGRLFLDLAARPRSILVLGHGASGGVGSADLELLAHNLPDLGTSVLRFEQPWRIAGRKVGAQPPQLDTAWLRHSTGLAIRSGPGIHLSWAVVAPVLGWRAV